MNEANGRSSRVIRAWEKIQELSGQKAFKASMLGLFHINWDELLFPERELDDLFRSIKVGQTPCPYGIFEAFAEFMLGSLASEQLSEPVENVFGYIIRAQPDAFEMFGYDTITAAIEADSGHILHTLLQSKIARPADPDKNFVYREALHMCCSNLEDSPECAVALREHIQFEGNSQRLNADNLDRWMRSSASDHTTPTTIRNMVQCGPLLSPLWLLHIVVKSRLKSKPELRGNDTNTPEKLDKWLLQSIAASGRPKPALLRALETELDMPSNSIKASDVKVATAHTTAAALKSGVKAHVDSGEPGDSVLDMVAVVLAWLVRVQLQPLAHEGVFALLQGWRAQGGGGVCKGGVDVARAVFGAALSACVSGGHTPQYEVSPEPMSEPWWAFYVDLDGATGDPYSEWLMCAVEDRRGNYQEKLREAAASAAAGSAGVAATGRRRGVKHGRTSASASSSASSAQAAAGRRKSPRLT